MYINIDFTLTYYSSKTLFLENAGTNYCMSVLQGPVAFETLDQGFSNGTLSLLGATEWFFGATSRGLH